MILDDKLLFEKNMSVVGSASAVLPCSNVIQLDAVKNYLGSSTLNDFGKADDVVLNVRVTSTQIVASSTAAALDIRLHNKASVSSIESGAIVYTVQVPILKAASIANHQKLGAYLVRAKVPTGTWGDTTLKYLGVSAKVLTQKISTGKITAWLGLADDTVLPAT